MVMYRNTNSVIRINITVRDKFGVRIGVHQGLVLSTLLFIVLEALSRECRSSLPWQMLYADDLVSITESLKELGGQVCCMEKWLGKQWGLGCA